MWDDCSLRVAECWQICCWLNNYLFIETWGFCLHVYFTFCFTFSSFIKAFFLCCVYIFFSFGTVSCSSNFLFAFFFFIFGHVQHSTPLFCIFLNLTLNLSHKLVLCIFKSDFESHKLGTIETKHRCHSRYPYECC